MTSERAAELIARWYDHGDREAGAELATLLHRHAHPGRSFVRALGQARVDELAQDTLVKVLDRQRRTLDGARDPVAFVRTVARNLAISDLRRRRRREHLALVRADEQREEVADAVFGDGDAERALRATAALPLESRLAVLLSHAPDRMSAEDWAELAGRHRPPPPDRPDQPLERDDASRLLWPPVPPEPVAERRRRLERIRKVLERAYARLAEALGGEG